MIKPEWHHIAGLHCQPDGEIAAVWLALDKKTDTVHLFDAYTVKGVSPGVIAGGFKARGTKIPIAWVAKDYADELLEQGCNMLPDAAKDSDTMAAVTAGVILERMQTGRFKIADKARKPWLKELDSYTFDDGKVPRGTHPLMDATRHAVSMLEWAVRLSTPSRAGGIQPEIAVI